MNRIFREEAPVACFIEAFIQGLEHFFLRRFVILVQVSYTSMSIDPAPSFYCNLPLLEFLRKYPLPKLHPLLLLLS
jgi:hypothetical protein